MSRKRREEFLAEAARLADELDQQDESLSSDEIDAALREIDCDPLELEGQLHRVAKDIESRMWAKGKKPPTYLRRIVRQTARADGVPADEARATARAAKWLEQFVSGVLPKLSAQDLAVVRAYRKEGNLSSNDIALLDELERELKDRLSGSNDE